jgi:hypothetical protein
MIADAERREASAIIQEAIAALARKAA